VYRQQFSTFKIDSDPRWFLLQESEVYADPHDAFIREPFIVRFRSECVVASVAEFTLIAVHIQPKAAVAEMDQLVEVHQFVSDFSLQ
jgi:hypothetical protein